MKRFINDKRALKLLNFKALSLSETRGIRTPDNLIKSQIINVVFPRFIGLGATSGATVQVAHTLQQIDIKVNISGYPGKRSL